MKKKTSRWIQKARNKKKKGALHRELGIPQEKKIPRNTLQRIKRQKVGTHIRSGGKSRTVTPLMKKRANFALNVRRKK
jgi:hypothetical protein